VRRRTAERERLIN